jgi:hypothetical protein
MLQKFEDLSKEALIDLLFNLQELLITEDFADKDETDEGVHAAIQLLQQYEPRLEVNYLDEFLKDSLGEDAKFFTSDGKNRECDGRD